MQQITLSLFEVSSGNLSTESYRVSEWFKTFSVPLKNVTDFSSSLVSSSSLAASFLNGLLFKLESP